MIKKTLKIWGLQPEVLIIMVFNEANLGLLAFAYKVIQ